MAPDKREIILSGDQKDVVTYRGGNLQVVACAGSGKTESISRRVASLILEGVEPASIVAFTFTERAAAEIKERITHRVGENLGKDFLDRLGPMFIGTIHGYCFRLLQQHVPKYGNYDVLDENRHAGFLSRHYHSLCLGQLGKNKHWQPIKDFIRSVDVVSNELINAEQLNDTMFGDCYKGYRELLDDHKFLTFGIIISSAVDVLESPEIFARVHDPLRYVIVDEYQDINPAQERLIELLSKPPVELCVVGDDDQSIYQWRGSDVRNILEFSKRYTGVKSIILNINRRSRPNIIKVAAAFAESIPDRLEKRMESAREEGENEVIVWSAPTDIEEAEKIAETIKHLKNQGYQYRDIAILYRSVRTSAPLLVKALRNRDIPFSCKGSEYSDDSALLFRRKAPSDSEGFRPGIPIASVHLFRTNRSVATRVLQL
ncbi:MAG TPA: ATP-dependent helicase [Candidatus Hydrogenedentes bacterium]|nr:ATP-dependent helicase [Candidatus Hydrogenedentota bacterium]